MIDLTKSQAQQNTLQDGTKTAWQITLDGELLYTLPVATTVQETFTIRDSIQVLLKRAFDAGIDQQKALAQVTLDRVVENGNAQLEALKAENLRLAAILETFISDEAE